MYDPLLKNKNVKCLLSIFIAFLVFLFLGLNENNAFALGTPDLTITVPVGTTWSGVDTQNSYPEYLVIDFGDYNGNNNEQFAIEPMNSRNNINRCYVYTQICMFQYKSGFLNNDNYPRYYNGLSIPVELKFYNNNPFEGGTNVEGTLNITENGTFDVSEYSQAVVNVPQDVTEIITDPISNDFHNVFMNIVVGIIPAFAVFVIVWFAIDLMSSLFFGRGK